MTDLLGVAEASQDLRCAVLTNTVGESPAGTAPWANRWVLVETAQPWPVAALDHAVFDDVADKTVLKTDTSRTLLVGSKSPTSSVTPPDSARVIVYDRVRGSDASDSLSGFDGQERVVGFDELGSLIMAAHAGDFVGDPVTTTDVLICTHGSRDRCCGSFGTRLFTEAVELQATGVLSANVRVWRTSHIGGHRFSPTGISFPDGTFWAGLDIEALSAITNHSAQGVERLSKLARGNTGISSRAGQVADIEGFRRHGWQWMSAARSWKVDGESVAISAVLDSGSVSYRATVEPGRSLDVPACGLGAEHSKKQATELLLTSFTPL